MLRPEPISPATPRISPRRSAKLTSASLAGVREMLDLERRFPGRGRASREMVGELAVGHPTDQLGDVDVRHRARSHAPAIAQHGDAVAHFHDLLHPMRNVDDPHPAFADGPNQAEQLVDLRARQGRRRFVHDDDPGGERQRARDLDHLLLRDAEPADPGVGVQFDAEVAQDPRRGGAHAASVEESLRRDNVRGRETHSHTPAGAAPGCIPGRWY